MIGEDDINEIGEELDLGETETNLANYIVPNLKNLVNLLEEMLTL